MDLKFEKPKHEILINDFDALSKKYNKKGQNHAEDILATVTALYAAPTLYDVPRAFRPHPLRGTYKGCFAVDVTDTHRVIFRPDESTNPEYRIDDYKSISQIMILEIFTDYH